jgi:hypothetical protein
LCGDGRLACRPSEARKFFFMKTLLSNVAAIWNLILLFAVIGTLAGFLYWFGLRRLIRARRIASSRDRRMLREAAEREVNREQ